MLLIASLLGWLFADPETVLTIPTHNDTILYTMNGGAIVTIISLTIWLIRTDLPRREAKAAEERERLRADFQALLAKMVENFRADIQLLTKAFTDEMHLERQSHGNEMQARDSAFEKMVTKLEARLAIIDLKQERNRG